MARTAIDNDTLRFIREAMTWPTIREIAEECNLSERFVRSMIERRKISVIRLDYVRIDPKSWAEHMATAYRPGQF